MPTCSGIINQLRFTLLRVSIGIFLAGESKGRGGTISSRQPHPRIADKIGSWIGISQVQESKGFFPVARRLLGIYQCGSPIPEVAWVGKGVFDTNRAAPGYLHGESRFTFPGMFQRQLHSKQEPRKENPLAWDKLQQVSCRAAVKAVLSPVYASSIPEIS